jgi:ABC-type Na+ transport system ATPase subunit NatA
MAKIDLQVLQDKYDECGLWRGCDELTRRRWAAIQAMSLGHGGITAVASVMGLSRTTITAAILEMLKEEKLPRSVDAKRIRRPGGGRKKKTQIDRTLRHDLELLVTALTREHHGLPLRRRMSTRTLAKKLNELGHPVGYRTVAKLLHLMNMQYRLPGV